MNENELKSAAQEYLSLETHSYFKQELQKVLDQNDIDNLNDRFYTQLSFGTGGLRGVIGGGYNRVNPFIIQQATQGLANYIKKTTDKGSVVIAYDSRNFSDLFAEEAARVLAANGIKVYLFSGLRPTPELSYAVRALQATAGIVVTASHNPSEYNGYKVYWSDGGQIVPPHDKGIIDEVHKVGTKIQLIAREEAQKKGLLTVIDEQIDAEYRQVVKDCSLRPELLQQHGSELKVVFTPLHGTGGVGLPQVLGEMGIEVIEVPEQAEPDGNFPTVKSPNPEEASAMKMAIELGKEKRADLVMGTDPDGDRLGIAVPKNPVPGSDNEFQLINGNQLGALLADYIFQSRKELGTLPDKPAFVKTIVTTELQRLIAESYGAASYDVLTGFKYIADKIKQFETSGETYVFGGEESYGYLATDKIRDKDAVSAAVLTAEMALYHRTRNKSLLDRLNEIYQEYGFFQEILVSRAFKGMSGKEVMDGLMRRLRENPPTEVGGITVSQVKDYYQSATTGLPSSNVLQFILQDGSIVTARPSGTEPKIKFYASCRGTAGQELEQAKAEVGRRLDKIQATIDGWVESAQK
ncbi:MAG: phospho-sugar mutase [Spirochaetia bacterium]|nr:phospho-sugar mutase [Spirochaetia bacterium]